MAHDKSIALSIAGFDPSGGAGVLADVKTFESHRVQGLGVCSALTIQNAASFDSIEWVVFDTVECQIRKLAERNELHWVKVGLVENLEFLRRILDLLKELDSEVKVIWDPVMRASDGFKIHGSFSAAEIALVCRRMYLVTPNREEILSMMPAATAETAAIELSEYCPVLLKGGHADGPTAFDILYSGRRQLRFESPRINGSDKHGTGCVLSAAITARCALGSELPDACKQAKSYLQDFLISEPGLLGRHKLVE